MAEPIFKSVKECLSNGKAANRSEFAKHRTCSLSNSCSSALVSEDKATCHVLSCEKRNPDSRSIATKLSYVECLCDEKCAYRIPIGEKKICASGG